MRTFLLQLWTVKPEVPVTGTSEVVSEMPNRFWAAFVLGQEFDIRLYPDVGKGYNDSVPVQVRDDCLLLPAVEVTAAFRDRNVRVFGNHVFVTVQHVQYESEAYGREVRWPRVIVVPDVAAGEAAFRHAVFEKVCRITQRFAKSVLYDEPF
jgi:hypothetical protein